ncbi:methylated-DNA--[protein]-cysteine S-methyltransferase [Dehalobacterium formicoaceticum]|uniref:methylated-DNA--[protein]-cysteine S-methyltransferase n=1 Tax=Dehalobacterium formicoaceticum TaxID=51515 RepID=UPI000B7C9C6C|nr:methylated-DNA--[protein]-cysteine S-methyltransferase [Dehalobacterium formicoaceticum]
MKNIFYYLTEIGQIGIGANGTAITDVFFDGETISGDQNVMETPLIQKASLQIKEYLEGKRSAFDVPLALEGTEFQLAAWHALQTIPYGETRSYKEMAAQIGNPKACRAIGRANNRNPIAIIIPCHRVIGANGKLVGYGGGLPIKERLLQLEKENKENLSFEAGVYREMKL